MNHKAKKVNSQINQILVLIYILYMYTMKAMLYFLECHFDIEKLYKIPECNEKSGVFSNKL